MPYRHVLPIDCRHAMAPSPWPSAAIILLLLLIMATSTGEGRARRSRRDERTHPVDVVTESEPATDDANNAVLGDNNGCYSCLYRGFLFPEHDCDIEQCAGMICYKVTAFVEGAPPGSPPWVAHSCAEPSVIEMVREEKAECQVLRQAAQKLDPNGGPAHGTTFNRCAIHTCENYGNDLPQHACNDGRIGPLWCWQYAVEHDENIIKDSSKDFYSESDYFRATQQWLQNQRNATKCSQQGLDSCLSLSGWFRGRRWSVQTCADTQAVVEMLDKDESCAYLQDTLSNDRMGKHVIRFSQNSAATTADTAASSSSSSSCLPKICDINGCNAQVPFFHLRDPPSSSVPTLRTELMTSPIVDSTTGTTSSVASTSHSPDGTRLSSSLLVAPTTTATTAPSSATSINLPVVKTSPSLLSWLVISVLPFAFLNPFQALVFLFVCFG